jgi:putative ABC transport system substrate-binding protein
MKFREVMGVFLIALFVSACGAQETGPALAAVLISGDIRMEPYQGLQDGLAELGYVAGEDIVYTLYNAAGDRAQLPVLAAEIVAAAPDVVIAGGGIESDALLEATAGTDLPVVFLSVSAAVDRGIVADMLSSGNNFTGIETNDVQLTEKRLELITRMMPEAGTVLFFRDETISPSAESAIVATEIAAALGLTLRLVDESSREEIAAVMDGLIPGEVDAILLAPNAPMAQALEEVIFPPAAELGVPIFGYDRSQLGEGAAATYAGGRYLNGRQAARLVQKVLEGVPPAEIPIETPRELEFVINETVVQQIGVSFTDASWGLADEVVQISVR